MFPKKRFRKNKYKWDETEQVEHPTLIFEMVRPDLLLTKARWPRDMDLSGFGNMIVALNKGELYEDIKKSVSMYGEVIGEQSHANSFNGELDRVTGSDTKKKKRLVVPPPQFIKYSAKRNHI